VEDWLAQKISTKQIVKDPSGRFEFNHDCIKDLLVKLNAYHF
jgi:hypothetical protein